MDGKGRAKRSKDALAGLTLGAVLGEETSVPRPQVNRTLLDIIREEEPNSRAYKKLVDHHHNKKSWKSFKDRLLLKKAGAVWTSSVPASDVLSHRNVVSTTTIPASPTATSIGNDCNLKGPMLAQLLRHNSVRVTELDELLQEDWEFSDVPVVETEQVHLLNRSLSRVMSLQSDLSQEDSLHIEQVPVSDVPMMSSRSSSSMLRRNLSRIPSSGQSDEPVLRLSEALAAEREQIQRVVSSAEAAGRARAREEDEAELENDDGEREEGGEQQQQEVRMSLMDLLGETDGQMGWSACSSDDDEDDEEEGGNLVERNCCVCMVRHKGSAFIPCGHTFCRLCSRELWVGRGNCPLCNGFILEILDIF